LIYCGTPALELDSLNDDVEFGFVKIRDALRRTTRYRSRPKIRCHGYG